MGEPQSQSGRYGAEKNLAAAGNRTSAAKPVAISTELSRFARCTHFMYLVQVPHNKSVVNPPQFWQAADITKLMRGCTNRAL
jgi:hypothetical protein